MTSALPEFEYAVMDSPDCAEVFRRWKAVECKDFVASIRGEWAQSPMHSGHAAFEITCSPDRRSFRVRFVGGVPSPVVLVARLGSIDHVSHFLGQIPRLINKETPYAWPSVMPEMRVASWVAEEWFGRSGESGGKKALDIYEPKLLEMRNKRLERAKAKKEREAALASAAAIERASEVIAALADRSLVADDVVVASLSNLSDADLIGAVSLSSSLCSEVAGLLITRADDIASRQHEHRGYLKPRESSLRQLAEKISRLVIP